MISVEALDKKVEFLLSFPTNHFISKHYVPLYIEYIETKAAYYQVENSHKWLHGLKTAWTDFDEYSMILCNLFMDLRRIKRSSDILLDKYPVFYYINAREWCVKFVNQVVPSKFFNPQERILQESKVKYSKILDDIFLRLASKEENHWVYYNDFRDAMIRFVGNGALLPSDVAKYLKLIEGFENQLAKWDDILSLHDKSSKDLQPLKNMDFFSEKPLGEEIIEERVTGADIVKFLTLGIEYIEELNNSLNSSLNRKGANLTNLYSCPSYEPLMDFVRDSSQGTMMLYTRTFAEIKQAFSVAQSVLNIYTPDLIKLSCLHSWLRIKVTKAPYDAESVYNECERNLELMFDRGLMTYESFIRETSALKSEIIGGITP